MKPWWVWKSPRCAEIAHFDIPWAAKEYLQNQVRQCEKESRSHWSDWSIDDLTTRSSAVREDCKSRLVRIYPGLLTGPHGAAIRHDPGWLPVYVVSGIVPQHELKTPYDTDLVLCTVLWQYHHPTTTGDAVASALTFFNNHVDQEASFSTFVIDGASTSRTTADASGVKGKGFILATQYFYERVEEQDAKIQDARQWKTGVSFRVGHQIGELSWRTTRSKSANTEKQLKVVMDDLTPWTSEQFLARLGLHDESDEDDTILTLKKHEAVTKLSDVRRQAAMKVLNGIYKRRFAQRLSERPTKTVQVPADSATDPSHELCRVRSDEVAITVLGLPPDLSPTFVFSGIYGIIPPAHAWRVLPKADTPIFFFKTPSPAPPQFYHRDQLVRVGPTLNRLSINYRGSLDLSADRTAVLKGTHTYHAYRDRLSRAAHLAFEFLPDLAKEIALDILTTDPGGTHGSGSSTTLSRVLHSPDTRSREGYRTAFDAAWRTLDASLPKQKNLYPYPASSSSDLHLIEEMGMVGRPVPEHVMTRILQASGAFTRIHRHAESLLLRAPRSKQIATVSGFRRLQRAISSVIPSVRPDDVVLVDYAYSSPKIVWDVKGKKFVMGIPDKCAEHGPIFTRRRSRCLCWVGPHLFSALDSWQEKQTAGSGKEGWPSRMAVCRAYVHCMEGTVNMTEPEPEDSAQDAASDSGTGTDDDATDSADDSTVTPHKRHRGGSGASNATILQDSKATPDLRLNDPTVPPSSPNGTPLTDVFNGVLDLCQRGLQEAANVEAERSALQTDTVKTEAAIHNLRDQAAQRQDEIQQLRDQLELKEAELDYTRGLLTAKWAHANSKRSKKESS